jgi:mannosylfructose-phosphate synthase
VSSTNDPAFTAQLHESFLQSKRRHVLMLSTHGVHQWQVVPGLPDTGGQNVFVNHFSEALAEQGYRVTIFNRGGYAHPVTGERQQGLHYKDAFQRLFYLEDELAEFVRKEDMGAQVTSLAEALNQFLAQDGTYGDVIISHYWDAARIGEHYNQSLSDPLPHVWVPHSLGKIKKANVSEGQWASLRIDERIEMEIRLLEDIRAVAATSSRVRQSLRQSYGYQGVVPFLPPCVDPVRYQPKRVDQYDEIWSFLADHGAMTPAQLQQARIVTEISRTDTTKRKDVLIKAFTQVYQDVPEAVLIVSIDDRKGDIAAELQELIDTQGIRERVFVVGSVWEQLPKIYAITDVYCTPSVMEGFGMSAQEAAATGVPVIASDLVPYVHEYLLGERVEALHCDDCLESPLLGEAAIEVKADDVKGFSRALTYLLQNDDRRRAMGRRALEITIPYFTWQSRTAAFLQEVELLSGDLE